MSLRHGVGRGRAGVDEVKYRDRCRAYLGRSLVGGEVVWSQAGGAREVGRQGSCGDKVVVVVDLVNHRGQCLHSLGPRGGVMVGPLVRAVVGAVTEAVVRLVVRDSWESRTYDWPCRGDVVSRVEYPGRVRTCWASWPGLQARQDTQTYRLQGGNMLGTFGGLRSDTVSHVKGTDISRGDRSVGTGGAVHWGRGVEWLRVIASWGGGGGGRIGRAGWLVFW